VMFLGGLLLMLYNVLKTMQGARMVDDAAVPAPAHH